MSPHRAEKRVSSNFEPSNHSNHPLTSTISPWWHFWFCNSPDSCCTFLVRSADQSLEGSADLAKPTACFHLCQRYWAHWRKLISDHVTRCFSLSFRHHMIRDKRGFWYPNSIFYPYMAIWLYDYMVWCMNRCCGWAAVIETCVANARFTETSRSRVHWPNMPLPLEAILDFLDSRIIGCPVSGIDPLNGGQPFLPQMSWQGHGQNGSLDP